MAIQTPDTPAPDYNLRYVFDTTTFIKTTGHRLYRANLTPSMVQLLADALADAGHPPVTVMSRDGYGPRAFDCQLLGQRVNGWGRAKVLARTAGNPKGILGPDCADVTGILCPQKVAHAAGRRWAQMSSTGHRWAVEQELHDGRQMMDTEVHLTRGYSDRYTVWMRPRGASSLTRSLRVNLTPDGEVAELQPSS